MTIAYETSVASSPADLLTKLAIFAAANGWTVNSPISGRVFIKGDIKVGAFGAAASFDLRGCLGYDSGAAWSAQPGSATVTTSSNVGAGPFTGYHFWAGDEGGVDYIHAAIEIADGDFRHFTFGQLIKAGSYTGGVYVDSVSWNTAGTIAGDASNSAQRGICDANTSAASGHIWADYDSKTNVWQLVAGWNNVSTNLMLGSTRHNSLYSGLFRSGVMTWNFRTPFFPMRYFANRAASLRSPLGRIPNMRFINLRNIAPKDEITIGGETWKCFPIVRRGIVESSGGPPANSWYYGYAYLMPEA